jgi:hypothetical protein
MQLQFVDRSDNQIKIGDKSFSVGDCITCDGISTPTKITGFGWNRVQGGKMFPTKILLGQITIDLNNEGDDDDTFLNSIALTPCQNGGRKSNPTPSKERVTIEGKKRVVYVGPKGGRYIKSKGKFIRI